MARRARAAGADSVEQVATLPGARGSVRAWVRMLKLGLDDAQASSQLRKWMALLQQLQGRRVAAMSCSPGGLGVLEFIADTWLADSFRHAQTRAWEHVVVALSIRGYMRERCETRLYRDRVLRSENKFSSVTGQTTRWRRPHLS